MHACTYPCFLVGVDDEDSNIDGFYEETEDIDGDQKEHISLNIGIQ